MIYRKSCIIAFFITVFFVIISCSASVRQPSTQQQDSTNTQSKKPIYFTVMQFNIWQQGTQVAGGFEAIVDEINRYKPDFATLVEIRNYNGIDFLKRLCDSLKSRGVTYHYHSDFDRDNAVISLHSILGHSKKDELNSMTRIVTKIDSVKFAIYSAHLDYTHYAEYLPRGYDGLGNPLSNGPITDVQQILKESLKSTRLQAIKDFISGAKKDSKKNRVIILGGDFNEASHLDWTKRTKDLYDHNGVVVSWPCSVALYKNNYKDSYRVVHPDELTYPGFTWPVNDPWIKDADGRDRIDFIYYYDDGRVKPVKSDLIGPAKSYAYDKKQRDPGNDTILLPQGTWPSDHRAIITKFVIKDGKF